MAGVKPKGYFVLNKRIAAVKLLSAKSCKYFWRPKDGIAVERFSDLEQLQRTFKNDTRMQMRVRKSDSQHTVIVIDTKKLQYGYEVYF